MAESKIELFSREEQILAKLAKALAHPARLKILKILGETNTCMVGDMVELLPLSQSTVSQHLKELKKAGLIRGEIEGPKRCYCLNSDILNKAKKSLEKLFANICQC
jgi:DNA-binding transcriptional ArsR family regulator